MTYLKWTCPECNDVVISIDKRHHQMNYCKCRKSYCDYEEYGLRWGGNKIVGLIYKKQWKPQKIDMNFFDEVLMCMQEQEIEIPTNTIKYNKMPVAYYDYSFLRDLEDEILEDLK